MEKKNKIELQARIREIQSRMSELNDAAYKAKREFSDEETCEWNNLSREKTILEGELRAQLNERELAKYVEHKSKGEQLRELFLEASKTGQKREVLLTSGTNSDATSNTIGNITASGAIELSIQEMLPTLNEGLGLPASLSIVTGVTGNEVWPVSVNDVEIEEVGEVAQLADQVLNFNNIQPTQRRTGLKVPVSNMAIDNAAFDLMAFVQTKFALALRKYLAKKIYSQASFTGNKGPFAGLSKAGDINLNSNAYRDILMAVAEFTDKGFFDGNVTLVMDAETEAALKATPKISGAAGGFVVENGLCCGYPYVVSHYINTTLSGTTLVPTNGRFIGIGYFDWLAVQQHGEVRMVVDPITLADRNVTRVILNTAWSITDLSVYINGGNPDNSTTPPAYPTQAFALYKIANSTSSSVI